MLKFFKGLSPMGGALLVSAISFGIFLRIYALDFLSHWSDELATLYYSQNPALIFLEETHPPLFYLFLKPFFALFGEAVIVGRWVVVGLSVVLNLYAVNLGRRHFSSNGFLIFVILIFLIPSDIAYARQARMYAPLFSLSLIFYLSFLDRFISIKRVTIVSFLMSWIFPLGFLPALTAVIYRFFRFRILSKLDKWLALSIIPIIVYYLMRLILLGGSGLRGDYLGEGRKVRNLLDDTLYTMAGAHIPKTIMIPLPDIVTWVFGIAITVIFVISVGKASRERYWREQVLFHGSVIFLSYLIIHLFSIGFVNIKVGRYLIFLFPVCIIEAARVGDLIKSRLVPVGVFAILLLYQVGVYKPLAHFAWEKDSVALFQEYQKDMPGEYVFCGNRFQYAHYFQSPHRHCQSEYERILKEKKDFVFMDVNGYMNHLIFLIAKDYYIFDLKIVGISTIAKARYRGPTEVDK